MSIYRFNAAAPFMIAFGLAIAASSSARADFPESPLAWPTPSATQKPWTRWWWLGSGVDKQNLTRELEAFAKAGMGGVEICPIYGAIGAEDRFLDFLSPKWMEMLAHTTIEAKRLGLEVDMTTGTGWPFGGPQVKGEMPSQSLQRIQASATGGTPCQLKLPQDKIVCLLAFSESDQTIDLFPLIKSKRLDWTPPAGKWAIHGLASKSPIQKVKRAAPGGAGNVLDPFSPKAMAAYLQPFNAAFGNFNAPKPRAQFHDSFEYYQADWTPALFETFKSARGYDLKNQLPAFNGVGDADTIARVRADYRETLGELHRDYLKTWHDWTVKSGGVTRNQAHGSPGNLLDHYAVSEIPETEIFRHVGEDQIPMLRFAASAAHSNGGSLVSSESFTWLGEHFQVTPEQLKQAADFVFLGGVNHLFFHGIPYSPEDAPWPGWLFYASTHMGPKGGLWRDLPTFNGYIQRCQSILQHGQPSSEVLIHFPFADLIHDGQEKLPLFTIHNQAEWLQPTRFYQTAMELWNQGITFDFASDDMLARASVKDGRIILGNNSFKALVIPGVKRMSTATLSRLLELASLGGTVIVQDGWPEEVPGFHEHENRRAALLALEKSIVGSGVIPHGRGMVILTEGNIRPALAARGVLCETMTEAGLRFVRRTHADGYHYFIVNRSGTSFDGIINLAATHESAVIMDPWRPDQIGVVTSKEIPIRLAPHQSIIIRTFTSKTAEGTPWVLPTPAAKTIAIGGPWKIEFIEGGPELPKTAEVQTLSSWTTLADPAVSSFSGTARYTTSFDYDGDADSPIHLDLGNVAHTARVSLNENSLGVAWFPPHRIDLTGHFKPGANLLSIEVTNLAANRIADLDRRKVRWKQFHEINFVNIDYKPFDASAWPALESGLLGPVNLLVK